MASAIADRRRAGSLLSRRHARPNNAASHRRPFPRNALDVVAATIAFAQWASIAATSAASSTPPCPSPSSTINRKPAAPDATACPPECWLFYSPGGR